MAIIDLGGWDTATAITFKKMNEVFQTKTPQSCVYPSDADTNKNASGFVGTWDTWSLDHTAAAEGAVLNLVCPIKSGNMHSVTLDRAGNVKQSYDDPVNNVTFNVQIYLQSVGNDALEDLGLETPHVPGKVTKQTTNSIQQNFVPKTTPAPPPAGSPTGTAPTQAATITGCTWWCTVGSTDPYDPQGVLPVGQAINTKDFDMSKAGDAAYLKSRVVPGDWNTDATAKSGYAKSFVEQLKDFVDNYFNVNGAGLKELRVIFASLVLGAEITSKDTQWSWLIPHKVAYAVGMPADATEENSVFGILCLTHPVTSADKLEATIDSRMIDEMSNPETEAVFAIGQDLFLKKWILPGCTNALPKTTVDDWVIDGNAVKNKAALDLGDIHASPTKDNDGNPIPDDQLKFDNATCPAGGWVLEVDYDTIKIDIENASWNWEYGAAVSGGIEVYGSFKDKYQIYLHTDDSVSPPSQKIYVAPLKDKDGKDILPVMTIQMTKSEAQLHEEKEEAFVRNIVLSIEVGAVAWAAGPAIEGALSVAWQGAKAGAQVLVDIFSVAAEDGGEAVTQGIIDGLDTDVTTAFNDSALTEETEEPLSNASDGAAKTKWQKFVGGAKSWGSKMWKARWITVGMTGGAVLGTYLSNLPDLNRADDADALKNIREFQDFADMAVDNLAWPTGETKFQLTEVKLAGSLLLGGKLTK